ncbi:MAG: hypothetical protein HUU10_04480 [Bacteroidetes bacterium]|nr:hypothetical protein [Bacteroidota bacterium]
MSGYRPVLRFDFGEIAPAINRVAAGIQSLTGNSPRTTEAVDQAVELIRDEWGGAVRLKAPQHASWYVPAIVRTPVEAGDNIIQAETYVASPYDKRALRVEEGTATDWDMKAHFLATSLKVRVSKAGYRYLIIPMKHSAKSLQAAGVYKQAKKLTPSFITGKRMEGSQQGASGYAEAVQQRDTGFNSAGKPVPSVRRYVYTWGGRLESQERHLNNLYRFGHTKTGGVQNSTYLTFRTMSEKPGSSPWIQKARPGMNVLKGVLDKNKNRIDGMIQGAIRHDLQEILRSISAN